MKLLELHIPQSYPASRLSRDDVSALNSGNFKGLPRARISSPCLKRAVLTTAASLSEGFHAIRSRILLGPFQEALKETGLKAKGAQEKAEAVAELFSKQDDKKPYHITTAVYSPPAGWRGLGFSDLKVSASLRENAAPARNFLSPAWFESAGLG
ncbi:MAG: type I-E CRISPR-associated protein Cas7/Cse4/CasC [Verrucomicrobiales bacterium]